MKWKINVIFLGVGVFQPIISYVNSTQVLYEHVIRFRSNSQTMCIRYGILFHDLANTRTLGMYCRSDLYRISVCSAPSVRRFPIVGLTYLTACMSVNFVAIRGP